MAGPPTTAIGTPEEPPSGAPRRQYQPRIPDETFERFQEAVHEVAIMVGYPVSNSEAMEALSEMLAVDRVFAGYVAQHLTTRKPAPWRLSSDKHRTTVRLSPAAADALKITIPRLGRSARVPLTTNDAMEALAEVLPADTRAPGRLARYVEAKHQGRTAAALDAVVAGLEPHFG